MPQTTTQEVLPERLTAAELAARLRVCTKTVLRLAQQRLIPAYQVGQQLRFDPEEVEAELRLDCEAEG